MKRALITGSAGLIGSEAVRFFCSLGFEVIGIDNNMRAYFFGEEASTAWNKDLLVQQYKNYKHFDIDIRNENDVNDLFSRYKFDLIIHSAAQPSHDWAAKEPLTDFSVNATGTLIMLEAFRKYCPEAVFIFTSTNKVYGDTPNRLPLVEKETRWEIDSSHKFSNGIDETMSLDHTKHSIFGASKVAADVLVQEYGRYFNLHTTCFRGGCLTGPAHSGTELHGFLAYLVKCIAEGGKYTIFGYKGKQVRDNIHSSDLIQMFYEFYKAPRIAEVYNAGGSRHSNVSMMEAIEKIESALNRKAVIEYSEQNRIGDHMWYISDVSRFKDHYPNWKYSYTIDETIEEICRMGHFSKPKVGKLVVSELGDKAEPEVFVSSHVTEAFGPVQALKSYLIKNYSNFVFVEHPFTYTNLVASQVDSYRSSLPSQENKSKKISNELLSYIQHFILTIYWFIKSARKVKLFIGIDALNAFAGVLLKVIGFKFDLVYYSVDYSPKRFSSDILNKIYHYIDNVSINKADYVWNSSERIAAVRKEQGIEESKNVVVHNGVNSEAFEVLKSKKRDKYALVVIDHFTKDKNIQMAIEALPVIRKTYKKAKLVVIGTGPYEENLKELAKRKRVSKYVEFKNYTRPEEYLEEISSYGIGLCLHKGTKTSNIYYSDPVSPKEMLAVGLPIVISKDLWLAKVTEEENFGIAVKNKKELVEAVTVLLKSPKTYNSITSNAIKFIKGFTWSNILETTFEKIKK